MGEFVKNEDNTVQEIPSGGVIIYIKAEVLDKGKDSQGNSVVQGEPTAQDNFASVTCDNLKERTGKDVIININIFLLLLFESGVSSCKRRQGISAPLPPFLFLYLLAGEIATKGSNYAD